MFGNLVSLLVLVALVVLFGYLAKRAWGTRRRFVKWPGVILASLAALLVALVALVAASGLVKLYLPASAPVTDLKVEGTPEQIARGKYLAYVGCTGCHGTQEEFPLAGGFDFSGEIPLPIGMIVSPNLTPGGILKERTDGELFHALRHGLSKDGKLLVVMSFMPFRQLSDEDTRALIAFMRSQPAVESKTAGGDDLNLLGALLFGAGMFPSAEPPTLGAIQAPPKGVTAEYGKYVATLGECRGCHGPDLTGTPPSSLDPVGVPNPRPIVGTWTREQFIQTMRTGVRPGGAPFSERMPWKNAARMDDGDLSALYEYLRKAP